MQWLAMVDQPVDWGPGMDPAGDTGMPGAFAAFFVLALIGGVVITIYKVVMARDLARRSGMDTTHATAMTLLEDDGLEATYLAADLRGERPAPPQEDRSVTARLAELDELRTRGLVTPTEYDERRAAILGSL